MTELLYFSLWIVMGNGDHNSIHCRSWACVSTSTMIERESSSSNFSSTTTMITTVIIPHPTFTSYCTKSPISFLNSRLFHSNTELQNSNKKGALVYCNIPVTLSLFVSDLVDGIPQKSNDHTHMKLSLWTYYEISFIITKTVESNP